MAEELIPLNSFKSVLTTLTGDDDVVYKTPTGVSTIVLSAQIWSSNRVSSNNTEIIVPLTISKKNDNLT